MFTILCKDMIQETLIYGVMNEIGIFHILPQVFTSEDPRCFDLDSKDDFLAEAKQYQ